MEDLRLDIYDYEKLLNYKGDIIGCVKEITKENFKKLVIEEYKEYLLNAKVIVIEFEINKEVSLFEINDYMSCIHDICLNDTSLIFSCKENKRSKGFPVVFRMLMSGLK